VSRVASVNNRGAVLPVTMVLLLLSSVMAMGMHRSAVMQLRIVGAMHDALRADLTAESALREAEGLARRIVSTHTAPPSCAPRPLRCAVTRHRMSFRITELGSVKGKPAERRLLVEASGKGASDNAVRQLQTIIVASDTPDGWRRESWSVRGDD
jgi:hypothetical protein